MAFEIREPREFTTDVEQWTRDTEADGGEMAKPIGKLVNNDVFLKDRLEELDGNALKVGDRGMPGGVATLGEDGKAEVGLGNVDNTADSAKSVRHASTAGDADTVDGKHAAAFAAASHTHSYAGSSSVGGAATSAVRLATARGIQVNLASGSAASFDGTANVTPGVTGILPVARGGTGNGSGYVRAGQKAGTVAGLYATAEGIHATASGSCSHAEGYNTVASGTCSYAGGECTIASAWAQTVIGKYNVQYGDAPNTANSLFIVGNGSSSARSNAFRVHWNGAVYAKAAYNASGADYAEYFDWLDGNPSGEDRRGRFVTLEGEKIRMAGPSDSYILGVVSGRPSVVGNSDPDGWHGTYLCDEFGEFIMERTVERRAVPMEASHEGAVEVDSYILSPDYDPDRPYVPRSERKEWAAVGLFGVLRVRDDGTCQPNGHCQVADGGIATAAESGWRVMSRVSDGIVKIVFR